MKSLYFSNIFFFTQNRQIILHLSSKNGLSGRHKLYIFLSLTITFTLFILFTPGNALKQTKYAKFSYYFWHIPCFI